MMMWSLPESAQIGASTYPINADYRDILEIIDVLNDKDTHERVRLYVALTLFYEGFEGMPPEDYQAAADWMMEFIGCGEKDDGIPQPKVIDWEQDRMIIAAEINKVAGTEVRNLEYLHWWTFVAYFNGIGEGQLSFIVSLREKLRKGTKLEKYEREYYNKNRARVDFQQKYTEAEKETLNIWLK